MTLFICSQVEVVIFIGISYVYLVIMLVLLMCVGKANATLTTVNTLALLINLEQLYWDTGGMTQAYNITCFFRDDNTTDVTTTVINPDEEEIVLSLDTDIGYTCCVSVLTEIGGGPVTCREVQPIPQPTEESSDVFSNGNEASDNNKWQMVSLQLTVVVVILKKGYFVISVSYVQLHMQIQKVRFWRL